MGVFKEVLGDTDRHFSNMTHTIYPETKFKLSIHTSTFMTFDPLTYSCFNSNSHWHTTVKPRLQAFQHMSIDQMLLRCIGHLSQRALLSRLQTLPAQRRSILWCRMQQLPLCTQLVMPPGVHHTLSFTIDLRDLKGPPAVKCLYF